MSIHQFNIYPFTYQSVHLTIHLPIHSLIYSPPHVLQFIQASHLSNHSFTYPCIQLSIHFTNICWSMLRGPFWPQAWGCHSLPCEYVEGTASLLMLTLLVHPHRHRLCLHRDRVPSECILHHHPGLGHVLPIPVLSVGAALGTLQPHLEHTLLYGGHYAQEQEPVDHPQHQQLHIPCHRILGVRPASLRKEGGCGWGQRGQPASSSSPQGCGSHCLGMGLGLVGGRWIQIRR